MKIIENFNGKYGYDVGIFKYDGVELPYTAMANATHKSFKTKVEAKMFLKRLGYKKFVEDTLDGG